MKAKEWFGDFARGATLGTGILPGVSVGTVGIIVNVYHKLLNAIDGLRKRKTFASSFLALLPIALGCLIVAVALMFLWKKVAYPHFPFIVISVLAGFVLGALPIITDELRGQKATAGDFVRAGIGFIIAAGIGIAAYLSAAGILPLNLNFQSPVDDPFHNWWIFLLVAVVGFFAAVSCLVPGISGSMVLFIFGLYNPIVGLFISDRDASGAIIHPSIFSDTSKLPGGLVVIASLLVGMLIGFLAISKFMKSMLNNHLRGTYGVILGFVLGSVVSMFLNNDMYGVYHHDPAFGTWQYIVGGILLVATFAFTYFLVRRSKRKPVIE